MIPLKQCPVQGLVWFDASSLTVSCSGFGLGGHGQFLPPAYEVKREPAMLAQLPQVPQLDTMLRMLSR